MIFLFSPFQCKKYDQTAYSEVRFFSIKVQYIFLISFFKKADSQLLVLGNCDIFVTYIIQVLYIFRYFRNRQ